MFFRTFFISSLVFAGTFSAHAAPMQSIDTQWTMAAGSVIAAGPISAAGAFDVLTEDRYGQPVLVGIHDGSVVPSSLNTNPTRSHLMLDPDADGQVDILSFSHSGTFGPLTLSAYNGHTVDTRWSVMIPGLDVVDSVEVGDVIGDATAEVLVHSNSNLFVYDAQSGALIYELCADNFEPHPRLGRLRLCRDLRLDSTSIVDVDGDGQMEILALSRSNEGHALSIAMIDFKNDTLQVQWSVDDVEYIDHAAVVSASRKDIIVQDSRYGGVRVLSAISGDDLATMPRPAGSLDAVTLRFVDGDSNGVDEILQIDRSDHTPEGLSLFRYTAGQMVPIWNAGWEILPTIDSVHTAQLNDDQHHEVVVQTGDSVKIFNAVSGELLVDTIKHDVLSGKVQIELKDWDGDGYTDVLAAWESHESDRNSLALIGATNDGLGLKWQRKDTAFPLLSGAISTSDTLDMIVGTSGTTELITASNGKRVALMPEEFNKAMKHPLPGVRAELLDVNGDSRAEVVLTCGDNARCLGAVYAFDGQKMHHTSTAKTASEVVVDHVVVANVNGNGRSELVYLTQPDERNRREGGMYIVDSSTGKILFDSSGVNLAPDSSFNILTVHDIDDNGTVEVVVHTANGPLMLVGYGNQR